MMTESRRDLAPDTVPDVTESSSYRHLVEHVLEMDDVCEWIRGRDEEGVSRRAIARELTEMLNARIKKPIRIRDVTVNRWCPK
jgi:hypothetical protein